MKKKEAKKLNKIDAQAVHKKRALITEKIRESFVSTLPIIIIVAIMCLSIQPVPTGLLLSFLIGALLIIVGMGLFTLGASRSSALCAMCRRTMSARSSKSSAPARATSPR